MSFFRRPAALIATAAILVILSGCAPKKIYIPVISKGFQHQFWQAVKLGAEQAAKQYGVEITFEGPPTEADIQPQVQMLVNAMAKNPSAICLAALDTNSVMDQLNQAIKRKIPIIGFDSGVPNAPEGAIYATAATNSYNAAGLAAEKMFDSIKDKVAAATAAKPGHDHRLQPGRDKPVGHRPRQGLPRRDDQAGHRPGRSPARPTSR